MITCLMLAGQITLPGPPKNLTRLIPYSYELFVAVRKSNPCAIKQIHTLLQNTRVRVPAQLAGRVCPHLSSIFIYLVFTNLQIPVLATPLLAHLYKTPGVLGVTHD